MGSLYLAMPRASNIPVEVATTTAVKTVLQVAVPSGTDIRVWAWGVSFDGIVATDAPGICTLMDTDVTATVTTVVPVEWESDDQPASACATANTGYNASAEGTIGATTRDLDSQNVHPQTGYSIWFPDGRHPRVKPSRFLRIRTTFAVTVNCIPWIIYEEPA